MEAFPSKSHANLNEIKIVEQSVENIVGWFATSTSVEAVIVAPTRPEASSTT